MFANQHVIPAISNHQDLKVFLAGPAVYGVLMNFQLAQLEGLVRQVKNAGKKAIIHSELIRGLASDEYGAIYLIQSLGVDGIISSKPKVIETCRKRGVPGIFRFFLKDGISLRQSLEIAIKLKPSMIEVLPAYGLDLVPMIARETGADILLGGLIPSKAFIRTCLDKGAKAVTTSNRDFWP